MSRLTIDLTDQQHQSIEAMAALQGKSIKEYAVERLLPGGSDEARALDELKALLQERVAQAAKGEISDESFSEIASKATRASGSA